MAEPLGIERLEYIGDVEAAGISGIEGSERPGNGIGVCLARWVSRAVA